MLKLLYQEIGGSLENILRYEIDHEGISPPLGNPCMRRTMSPFSEANKKAGYKPAFYLSSPYYLNHITIWISNKVVHRFLPWKPLEISYPVPTLPVESMGSL